MNIQFEEIIDIYLLTAQFNFIATNLFQLILIHLNLKSSNFFLNIFYRYENYQIKSQSNYYHL